MLKVNLSDLLSPLDRHRISQFAEKQTRQSLSEENYEMMDRLGNYDRDGVSYDGSFVYISGEGRIPIPHFRGRLEPVKQAA